MSQPSRFSLFHRLSRCLGVTLCIFVRTGVAADAVLETATASLGTSAPVAADLDGNPSNGLELVTGSSDGVVTALRTDGTILWRRELPNFACRSAPSTDKVWSSAAIGALRGDGVPYVVIGYGGFRGQPCDGGVAAIRGSDGQPYWTFSIKAFAKKNRFYAFRNAVFGTPALADVDGDGKLEVGFGGFDRNLYLLEHDGKVRWTAIAADTVFSSPAFVDIDGDRKLEMIMATDISQNLRLKPATPNGGYVYAFRTAKGRGPVKYGFRDVRVAIWRAEFEQVMQSPPTAGELIASNPGPELVVGSGCFFPQGGGPRRGRWFKILSAKTGKTLRTLPIDACSPSLPAIADLDGDGKQEVVVVTNGDPAKGGDGDSYVTAWSPEADVVLWRNPIRAGGSRDAAAGDFGRSAAVADLDANGSLEVIATGARGLALFEGATGNSVTCSECLDDSNLRAGGRVSTAPFVSDVDGDGRVEILAGGAGDRSGAIFMWSNTIVSFNSLSGNLTPGLLAWPSARGDLNRSGAPNGVLIPLP